jgi:hypothetical protein
MQTVDTVTTSRQRTVSIFRDTSDVSLSTRPRGVATSKSLVRPVGGLSPRPPPRPSSLPSHTSEAAHPPTAPDPPVKETEETGPPSVQKLFSQSDYLLRNNGEQVKLEEVWKNQVIGIFFSTCG